MRPRISNTDFAGRANSNSGTILKFQSERPNSDTMITAVKTTKIAAIASVYAGGFL